MTTLYTRVTADKEPYNVPKYINCSRCGKTAFLDSDIELYENRISRQANLFEENYKCVYTCQDGHETNALVEVRE